MKDFTVFRRSDLAVLTRAGFKCKNPPRHFDTFEQACGELVKSLQLTDRGSLPVGEYRIAINDNGNLQSAIDPSSGGVYSESVPSDSANEIMQTYAVDSSSGEVCRECANDVMQTSAEGMLQELQKKFEAALEPTYRSCNVNAPLFDLYHAAEFTDDSSDDVLLFDALKEQADKHKVVREGLDIVNTLLNAIAAADGYGR